MDEIDGATMLETKIGGNDEDDAGEEEASFSADKAEGEKGVG